MTTQSRTASLTPAGDRRLARIAAVGIAISLAAGAARLLHVLPSGAAAAIDLVLGATPPTVASMQAQAQTALGRL